MALYWSFTSSVGVKFTQSSSQLEARANPEEMSQILLTNKKQGNLVKYTPLTLSNQRKLALTARHFLRYKFLGAPKKLKRLACPQKPNPSRETVPLSLRKLALTTRNTIFFICKIIRHQKKLKTGCIPSPF